MNEKEFLRTFLRDRLPQGQTLRDDESLWDSGAIDSLGLLELAHAIESEFKIKIPERDINLETFRSVSSLSEYLRRKIARP